MTGGAYATSAEIASELGAFKRYEANREPMLRVIRNHRRAAYNAADSEYEGLTVKPAGISPANTPASLLAAAKDAWDDALEKGEKSGYRNAQVTVIAPTGTIGLVMDCDTTGIEPDFALVKFKKLAGGGYFKIINQSVPPGALSTWATPTRRSDDIILYCVGHGTLARLARHRPRHPQERSASTMMLSHAWKSPSPPPSSYRLRLQPLRARRGVLQGQPRPDRRADQRPRGHPPAPRLQQGRHLRRQRLCMRHDDP